MHAKQALCSMTLHMLQCKTEGDKTKIKAFQGNKRDSVHFEENECWQLGDPFSAGVALRGGCQQ